jgi:hypothetical protein
LALFKHGSEPSASNLYECGSSRCCVDKTTKGLFGVHVTLVAVKHENMLLLYDGGWKTQQHGELVCYGRIVPKHFEHKFHATLSQSRLNPTLARDPLIITLTGES